MASRTDKETTAIRPRLMIASAFVVAVGVAVVAGGLFESAATEQGDEQNLHERLAHKLLTDERPPAQFESPTLPEIATPKNQWRAQASELRAMLLGEGAPLERAAYEAKTLELAALIRKDPELASSLFDEMLVAFEAEHGHALVRPLALSESGEIVADALRVATTGEEERERLGALRVLDQIDSTDPSVRRELMDLMAPEESPDVQLGAMYGLERAEPTAADAADVVDASLALAGSADVEVRRRALMTAGNWATTDEQIGAIAAGLDDPEMLVRAATAFALGETSGSIEVATGALIKTASNTEENAMVRAHACRAFDGVELDDATETAVASACDALRTRLTAALGG